MTRGLSRRTIIQHCVQVCLWPGTWTFCIALAVYRLTLHPGAFTWDSAHLAAGVYTQGVVHATGYPLYLITARVFALVPWGEWGLRTNLFSAVMAALAAAAVYQIGFRLTARRVPALVGALFYAFIPPIWEQAIVAEVYALHTALIALALLLVLYWQDTRRSAYLAGTGIMLGLAFGNHMSTLLVALILVPYMLVQPVPWRIKLLSLGIMGSIAALLYLYLPVRFAHDPALNLVGRYFDRDLCRPADLLWMVSGRMFGHHMFDYSLAGWIGEIATFGGKFGLNLLGAGALLCAAGLYRLNRQRAAFARLLALLFGAQVLFFSGYSVFDKWAMFHTAYLVASIPISAGGAWLADQISSARLAHGMLIVLVGAQLATHWTQVSRRDDGFVAATAQDVLDHLPERALLIGAWTTLSPVEYIQIVHNRRPDVALMDVTFMQLGALDRFHGDEQTAAEAVRETLRVTITCTPRPVYVTSPDLLPPGLYDLVPIQSYLYRVEPAASPGADVCGVSSR